MSTWLIPLMATAVLSSQVKSVDHHVLSFGITDQMEKIDHSLPNGLHLSVTRVDSSGWDVGVFKGKGRNSLLYPQVNWHGAWPCQVYAWSHQSKFFPDIRVIPIRGYKLSVVVVIDKATTTGTGERAEFSGGQIHIYWRHGA